MQVPSYCYMLRRKLTHEQRHVIENRKAPRCCLLPLPHPCGARIYWTASGARCITRIITSAFQGRISATSPVFPSTIQRARFAESWDASRLTLQEHQCRVHVSPYIYHGPLHLRIWEEKDPNTQQVIAIKNYISTYEQTRTIWMDGRPHPPDYAVAHLHGIFHRQVGRRHSDGLHHAHQAGLGSPQRASGERPSHDDRAFSAARKHHDAHDDPERSGVSGAAADSHRRFSSRRKGAGRMVVALRILWKRF